MSEPLFQRVLGAEFETLPPAVRALHTASGHRRYQGQVEVVRGGNPLARLFAWATRLPPAGQGEVEVEIDASGEEEKWTRHIGGHAMPSRLWEQDGLLCEQLGLARFGFRLTVEEGGIVWRVARVTALSLPLPARWFGKVQARESQRDGRYRFDVAAALPVVGLLVRYRGWLNIDSVGATSPKGIPSGRKSRNHSLDSQQSTELLSFATYVAPTPCQWLFLAIARNDFPGRKRGQKV